MRKALLIFIALMAYPADAQVISGSIVIFNFTKDKTIVAADSLAINHDIGAPDYSHCKIAAFGHQLIFTSVGNTGWSDSGRIVWDNSGLARDAFHSAEHGEQGAIDPNGIASLWARDLKSHWSMVSRERAAEIAPPIMGRLPQASSLVKD